MGMFDWYEPAEPATCDHCGEQMLLCQGKDGPNYLFVWREGVGRMAVAHRVDEPLENLEEFGLPHRFSFACWCPNDHMREFVGECVDGIWSRTVPAAESGRRLAHQ